MEHPEFAGPLLQLDREYNPGELVVLISQLAPTPRYKEAHA
jgi:hypothetical protein